MRRISQPSAYKAITTAYFADKSNKNIRYPLPERGVVSISPLASPVAIAVVRPEVAFITRALHTNVNPMSFHAVVLPPVVRPQRCSEREADNSAPTLLNEKSEVDLWTDRFRKARKFSS